MAGPQIEINIEASGRPLVFAGSSGPLVVAITSDPDLLEAVAAALTAFGCSTVSLATDAVSARGFEELGLEMAVVDVSTTTGRVISALVDADVPAIGLVDPGDTAMRVGVLEAGFASYLIKPCGARELVAAVRALLRLTHREPRTIRAGPMLADSGRNAVEIGEIKLDLPPKEFGLLVTLARSPSRVFTRAELLRIVWHSHIEFQDARTIDEHVRRLRARFRDVDLDSPIETCRGRGYVLARSLGDAAGQPAQASA